VRAQLATLKEERLRFHYRLAPELCEMADRIETTITGDTLSSTSHYNGPKPGRIQSNGPLPRTAQIILGIKLIKDQLRAYGDMIAQGDRIGLIVPRIDDREYVLEALESDPELTGKAQIIRARTGESDDRGYNPAFDAARPVVILTEKGSKGLEFRALRKRVVKDLNFVPFIGSSAMRANIIVPLRYTIQ